MEWLRSAWEFLSQLDRHITDLAGQNPALFYGLYSGSIFAETGLVVMPILPSETLVFSVGVLAASNHAVDPWLAGALALVATLLGDCVGMMLGRTVGRRWLLGRSGKVLGEKSVRWSERYFDRYGPRTVLISRFLPIIRSAAPFLAGTAQMPIRTFLIFNGAGAVIWSVAFMAGGYFFGQIPFVEENIGIIVPVLGAIVAIPLVLQIWQSRRMAAADRDGGAGGSTGGP